MAQTGYTPISIYYSATATNTPTAGNLVAGELAINTADGKLFYKDSSGVVQTLATKATTAGTYSSITTSNLTIGTTQLGAGNASIMKNRIINGAMVIDQRNAGASVTPTTVGNYTYSSVDRLWYLISQSSKFTIQQNAGAITPPNGFSNYVGITSSAATSVGTGDYFWIGQSIEGFNTSDFSWGTANAKTITLSAWVYSSLTGTFGGSLYNSASNYFYPFTYTISSANTWTQISITVTGPTSGTWVGATNGIGVRVLFNLGAGSTYTGTAGAWASGSAYAPTGAVNVVGTSGATFYITGVQLEVGSSATGFEYVNYQTSLANCQRYFVLTNPANNTRCGGMWGSIYVSTCAHLTGSLPVSMRTAPTVVVGGTNNTYYMSNVNGATTGTPQAFLTSVLSIDTEVISLAASSVGVPVQFNGQLSISAEL